MFNYQLAVFHFKNQIFTKLEKKPVWNFREIMDVDVWKSLTGRKYLYYHYYHDHYAEPPIWILNLILLKQNLSSAGKSMSIAMSILWSTRLSRISLVSSETVFFTSVGERSWTSAIPTNCKLWWSETKVTTGRNFKRWDVKRLALFVLSTRKFPKARWDCIC